jgi:hypothetical protein
MAEIKSSLEIALERAAAMGGGGREEIDREEGMKRGQLTARKILLGELEPRALADETASLSGEGLSAARKAAAQILLEAVPQAPVPAIAGLEVLVDKGDGADALQSLIEAVAGIHKADNALAKELTLEMTAELSQMGIGGSAVTPNPMAHPAYQDRRKAALAEGFKRYNAAARQLAEVFGLA